MIYPKNVNFSQVRGHENLHFFDLLESLLKNENHYQMTTEHLKWKHLLSLMRDVQKSEMSKNDIFFLRSGDMKYFNFFDFLQSLLK